MGGVGGGREGREVCVEVGQAWLSMENLALSRYESSRRNVKNITWVGVDISLVSCPYLHSDFHLYVK